MGSRYRQGHEVHGLTGIGSETDVARVVMPQRYSDRAEPSGKYLRRRRLRAQLGSVAQITVHGNGVLTSRTSATSETNRLKPRVDQWLK